MILKVRFSGTPCRVSDFCRGLGLDYDYAELLLRYPTFFCFMADNWQWKDHRKKVSEKNLELPENSFLVVGGGGGHTSSLVEAMSPLSI